MRNLTITGLSLFLGISIPQFFVHYWDARHYGIVHTDAGWFNAFLNTVYVSTDRWSDHCSFYGQYS
ncbi:hypothetical protein F2Q70_00010451 [Brassica cretica]|uniref:Uncharacterized protein n=1 Tax=Brassica cretica TaxID=69181 RepID=A0A8S9LZ44_BRACR|nr:hypothetical protein F2Q70_00010451 [Brassica cretica]